MKTIPAVDAAERRKRLVALVAGYVCYSIEDAEALVEDGDINGGVDDIDAPKRFIAGGCSGERFNRNGYLSDFDSIEDARRSLASGVFDDYPSAPLFILDLDRNLFYDVAEVRVVLKRKKHAPVAA